jgi:4-hydroxy-2-oxoglutarate aldolase
MALELFGLGQARDEERGVPFQARVTRVNRAIAGVFGPAGVKAAMNLAGLKGGIPRRPLLPLTPAQQAELQRVLTEEGLLP